MQGIMTYSSRVPQLPLTAAVLWVGLLAAALLVPGQSLMAAEGSGAEMARRLAEAEKGNEFAQKEIAENYALGKDIKKDPVAAENWFKRFAGNDPEKARRVGYFYQNKAKQPAMAVKWYEKAAQVGSTTALVDIGHIYRYREGGLWDPEKAFAYFSKAAELGNLHGHAGIGRMYLSGEGWKKNYVLARKHLLLGQDEIGSAYLLGRIYNHGLGIKKDPPEAFKWFRKAAMKRGVFAMHEIGKMYRHGLLAEKDRDVNALAWFLVGANFDYTDSDRAARAMYLRVSPQVARRAGELAEKIIAGVKVERDLLEELGILDIQGVTPP